jgi:hypothetical protein
MDGNFDINNKWGSFTSGVGFTTERIQRREERFIDTMMLRMRGKEISYNEASHILQEMLKHMRPEHAERLVYDMAQRLQLLQDLCYERRRGWEWECENINNSTVYEKLKVKTQEFLTRNDMEIE